MYLVANKKNLKTFFPEHYKELNKIINGKLEDVKTYKSVISLINECYNEPDDVNLRLTAVNEVLHLFGVEGIEIEGEYIDYYNFNIVADYVNTGDTYATTILHNNKTEKYYITSYGDFIEKFYMEGAENEKR